MRSLKNITVNARAALRVGTGMALVIGMMSASAVSAQELDEIVVTARSRGESVQSVPLAITAFSGDELEKRAVVSMADVSRMTPGFAFEDYGTGSTSPVIRGTTQVGGSTEQPVSFFLDGVYLPRAYVTNIGFWGMERLEVVKGPQSARYGRNAFSGAVNYISRKPSDKFGAEVEATAGINGRFDVSGLVTGPIIPGVLSAIAGISKTEYDGSWENTHPFCDIDFSPGTDCRVGGYNNRTINAGLRFTPTERLTVDITYFNFKKRNEQSATVYFGELDSHSENLNCGQWNADVRPAGAGTTGYGGEWYRLYCGQLPVDPMPVDPRGYGAQTDSDFIRASIEYSVTDNLTLSYLYGRITASNDVNYYNDQLPDCGYLNPNLCNLSTIGRSRVTSQSHDARLSYDAGGALSFSAGYLYAPSHDWSMNAFGAMDYLNAVPTESLSVMDRDAYAIFSLLGSNVTSSEIHSPFAEIQLKLLDGRLRFGAEGRYTAESRFQQAIKAESPTGDLVMVRSGPEFRANYHYFTPRFTVDYDLAPRHLLFASVAKGVKAGGFNTAAYLPEYRVYGGDQNWTYEIGSKNAWGPLRLNASLFLIKWSDMQIPAADPQNPAVLPQSITMNLGNLTSKGIEVETEYRVSSNFTVGGTLYHGKSTYDEGTHHLNYARTPAVCDDIVCPMDGNVSGKSSPRAPNWMATLAADWTGYLSDGLDYYIHGDLSYQSKAYADEMNLAWVSSRVVTNATFGLKIGGHYEARLWVRNLFDEKYLSNASVQSPNVSYRGALGERRSLGVTLSAKY